MAAKETRARSQRRDVKTQPETSETSHNRARYFNVFLRVGFAALATTTVLTAPEGAIRNGDFLPTVLALTLFCLFLAIGRLAFSRDSESAEGTSERARRAFSFPDWALILFLLLATVSYLRVVVTKCGDVRFSTNAYWTFTAPALFYFILRRASSLLSPRAVHAIFTLIVACSVAESAYSLYSYAVVNPAIRAQYLANPEQTLKDAGISFSSDSQERLLFEKRLLESSEPTGTYGLANTLAGVLASSLMIALLGFPWFGAFKRTGATPRSSKIAGALWGAVVLLILAILMTTKSRSAVLATFACLLIYGLYQGAVAIRSKVAPAKALKLASIVFGAFAVVLAASVFAGIIDKEVFTEAGKSLGYRLDYWRATSRMIRDYPIWGVGPGEFQSVYAQYILPTASEFIADPHNFAFEIAALFGVPAFVAFAFFLLGVFVDVLRVALKKTKDGASFLPDQHRPSASEDSSFRDVVVGFFLGLAVAFFTSFLHSTPILPSFYIVAVPPAVFVFATSRYLTRGGDKRRLTPVVAGAATLAVLINLLAAGGIGYPCVSTLIFILSAVVVESQATRQKDKVETKRSKPALLAFAVGLGVVVAAFYSTAFKPRCQSFLFSLNETAGLASFSSPAEIDPYSIEVARAFYSRAAQEYFKSPKSTNREAWQNARDHVKKTSPHSPSLREGCADLDWLLYQQAPQRLEFGESALDFYRESVERSPTDVSKRAKLSRALAALGRRDEAIQEANRALEGDLITPHLDRKLRDEDRRFLTELVGSADAS